MPLDEDTLRRLAALEDQCESVSAGNPMYWDECRALSTIHQQQDEIRQLRAEVERLREERRWIPVEERLPEFEVPVFCHAYGSTWIGCRSSDEDGECWCGLLELPWYHKKGRWVVDPEFGDYKPTHWHPFPQPLPAPPGEEE